MNIIGAFYDYNNTPIAQRIHELWRRKGPKRRVPARPCIIVLKKDRMFVCKMAITIIASVSNLRLYAT
jgi:hypothetical protein